MKGSSIIFLFFLVILLSWKASRGQNYANLRGAKKIRTCVLAGSTSDCYAQLNNEEKEEWIQYSHQIVSNEDLTIEYILQNLEFFEERVMVHIRLVGYDGNGERGYKLDLEKVETFFSRLNLLSSETLNIINTENDDPHDLKINRKYFFGVSKAPTEVISELNTRLARYVSKPGREGMVPYSVVHNLLQQDYEYFFKASPSQPFVLYILNPAKTENRRYYYSQDPAATEEESEPEDEDDEVIFDFTMTGGAYSCPTGLWADKSRFMWVDLSVAPLDYGPYTSGEGLVDHDSFASIPPDPKPLPDQTEYILQLADFVGRTRSLMIGPSVFRSSIPHWRSLTFHFIFLHDHSVGEVEKWEFFNLDAIKSELRSLPLFPNQEIHFKKSELSLVDNNICAAIYTNSLSTHTSTVVRSTIASQVHQYLDSKEVHFWLNKYQTELFEMIEEKGKPFGGHSAEPATVSQHQEEVVLPIYIFDVSWKEVLLLDRHHQAVSFPDMVVAVQTTSSKIAYDLICKYYRVTVDGRDASRAVLASTLETVWGVSPTHQTWDPSHNKPRNDYLWAVGPTPFGQFSSSLQLSFSQTDAVARNPLYLLINNTLEYAAHQFLQYSRFGVPIAESFSYSEFAEFRGRWEAFLFKLREAQMYFSFKDFNNTLLFLLSMEHELFYFHDALNEASNNINSYIACWDEDDDSYSSILNYFGLASSFLFFLFLVFYFTARKCRKPRKFKSHVS